MGIERRNRPGMTVAQSRLVAGEVAKSGQFLDKSRGQKPTVVRVREESKTALGFLQREECRMLSVCYCDREERN